MKLQATIANSSVEVELRRQGDRILAVVDGRSYELEMRSRRSRSYLLLHDGAVFDCRLEYSSKSGDAVDVIVGSDHYLITLTDPKRLRGALGATGHADGAVKIIAPMPGKVVRVLVNVGDQVAANAGIVVVEAMKMQNEMKSPRAGIVAALNAEVGATVNGGDVLAVIE